eukprot:2249100-Prorocentrum_lima.AAC.1
MFTGCIRTAIPRVCMACALPRLIVCRTGPSGVITSAILTARVPQVLAAAATHGSSPFRALVVLLLALTNRSLAWRPVLWKRCIAACVRLPEAPATRMISS